MFMVCASSAATKCLIYKGILSDYVPGQRY